jgi:hypothetical protein
MQKRTFETLTVPPQKHMFTLMFCSAIITFISGFGSVYDLKVLLLLIATIKKLKTAPIKTYICIGS